MDQAVLPVPRLGEWLLHRARRGRDAFALGFGKQRTVYLLAPEHNELVFAHDDWFSVAEAYRSLEVVDGPTSVVLSDGAEHTRRRGLIRPTVAPRRIDGYVASMRLSADEALAELPVGGVVDAAAVFRSAIRRSTLRALFGPQLARHADELGELLQPQLDLIDALPQVIDLHRRLRTPAWRRAARAQVALDAVIGEFIDTAQRAGPAARGGSGDPSVASARDGARPYGGARVRGGRRTGAPRRSRRAEPVCDAPP